MSRGDDGVERDEGPEPSVEAAAVTDYRRLPDPVKVEGTIASHEAAASPDPNADRDPERDFMLRYGG